MTAQEYFVQTFTSFFIIMSHIPVTAFFLAITAPYTQQQKISVARTSCLVATFIFLLFAATGQKLFALFGISIPVFRIAGGLLLCYIGFELLKIQATEKSPDKKEELVQLNHKSVAITPLAVPMIAGPGCISTIILRQGDASTLAQHLALYGIIILVMASLYLCFRLSINGARWLTPTVIRLSCRLSGLLLIAIAVQSILNGIHSIPIKIIIS